MYEDFVQKRNWARLVKLAKDKSNLPIASAMDAIVASVRALVSATAYPSSPTHRRYTARSRHLHV